MQKAFNIIKARYLDINQNSGKASTKYNQKNKKKPFAQQNNWKKFGLYQFHILQLYVYAIR